MRSSKLVVALVLILTLTLSFAGGYIVTRLYSQNSDIQDKKETAEAAKLLSTKDLVNSNTEIIKKLRYNINGTTFLKELKEKATSDVLGMDRIAAENYFKLKDYNMLEFTSQSVVLAKDINSWPTGCFVVKANGEYIAIYEVDDKGKLILKESTDIKLEYLPEEDRSEVIAGKIFETIDEAYWLLEEYSS